ncbi:MAG: orotidine-5'-phosphate decarboxylase [Candidatus Brocadiia bacterium]
MNFADRLFTEVESRKSVVVVGLDPRVPMLPSELTKDFPSGDVAGAARAIYEFNKGLIDAVAEYAVAVKPQIAFYEQLGLPGLNAFAQTCAYASAHGLLVIADAKRGDIGTTAEAYADAFLGGPFASDAMTVNPYLGTDALVPFVAKCQDNFGLFILVRTSNKGAVDFQDLPTGDCKLYEKVADLVAGIGKGAIGSKGYSSVGAVVGATWPGELSALRRRIPSVPFLVPGYGAQGGTAADIRGAFDQHGLGAIVNSSREICFAFRKKNVDDWKGAAAQEAKRMRDEFRSILGW